MNEILKILKLIKENTDKDHPLSQFQLRELPSADAAMGYKNTFNRRLREIADSLNRNETGELLPEDEWRIVFPGYAMNPGEESNGAKSGKIYYKHEIEPKELDIILECLRTTDKLTAEEIDKMEKQLIKLLASKYYEPQTNPRGQVQCFGKIENKDLTSNLKLLRQAIEDQKMVEFHMLGVNRYGSLFPKKEREYRVSPYKIVFCQGDYWLLGNCQKEYDNLNSEWGKYSSDVSVYRVDLMGDLKIARTPLVSNNYFFGFRMERTSSAQRETRARYPFWVGKEVEQWNRRAAYIQKGELLLEEPISFRIDWKTFDKKERDDYRFVYDSFGEACTVNEADPTIVSVNSSVSFFVDWAMRYIDKIEIISDNDISKSVKNELVRRLNMGLEKMK